MLLRRTAIVLRPREKGSNKPTGKERMISCYISAGLVPRVLSSRVFNYKDLGSSGFWGRRRRCLRNVSA